MSVGWKSDLALATGDAGPHSITELISLPGTCILIVVLTRQWPSCECQNTGWACYSCDRHRNTEHCPRLSFLNRQEPLSSFIWVELPLLHGAIVYVWFCLAIDWRDARDIYGKVKKPFARIMCSSHRRGGVVPGCGSAGVLPS